MHSLGIKYLTRKISLTFLKRAYSKKLKEIYTEKPNFTPQHVCVAEDILLLNGGVLYGFKGQFAPTADRVACSKFGHPALSPKFQN